MAGSFERSSRIIASSTARTSASMAFLIGLPEDPLADGEVAPLLAREVLGDEAAVDAAEVALLAHLIPRQREVLVLRVAVGASAEETAQAVGSTTGAGASTGRHTLGKRP